MYIVEPEKNKDRHPAPRILITDTGSIIKKAFFSNRTEMLRCWEKNLTV